jgi:glycosyltransferase involved in cell wall biosynthesis
MYIYGGAETHVFELIKNLTSRGVSCSITYQFKEVVPHFESLKVPMYPVKSSEELAKRIQQIEPDVFQFFHAQFAFSALSLLFKRPKTVEVVHNRRHFQGDSTCYSKVFTSAVVAVSQSAADYFLMQTSGQIPCEVILNGIDREKFKPGPKKVTAKNRRPLGGFTGRLEHGGGKGVEDLVDTMRSLDVDFELVGHDYSDHFKMLLTKEGITNIKVLPHKSDVLSVYRSWDFFVSASPAEGFGLSIVEALACGLPSVLRDCGGAVNYIEHNKHAIIYEHPRGLKAGVERVLKGDIQLEPRSAVFCAREMTDKYHQLYQSLLNVKEKPKTTQSFSQAPLQRVGLILGTCPGDWKGIRHSLENLCDKFADHPSVIAAIDSLKPTCVVFGTYNHAYWRNVALKAKAAGAKTLLTWHGTVVLGEFDASNRACMAEAIDACTEGLFDAVGSPHEGVVETFKAFGVRAYLVPNTIQQPPRYTPGRRAGLNIGVFGTGLPWKNMDCQTIAASMLDGATVFTQQERQNELNSRLKIPFRRMPKMEHAAFLNFLYQMSINFCVGITETFSYLAAESLFCGTPVVAGGAVPLFKNCPEQLKRCIVTEVDNPAAIKRAAMNILENYEEVQRAGRAFIEDLNERNKASIAQLKTEWVQGRI